MTIVTNVIVAIVALLHCYFLVLEMFFWTKPLGMKVFKQTAEKAEITKILAANQGLYNGFLAAGLIWGLILGNAGTSIVIFFLSCVLVAGIYGAATVGKKILLVQAMPAAVGLLLVVFVGL